MVGLRVKFLIFLGSSAVERSAVNRLVAGSNPARGVFMSLKSCKVTYLVTFLCLCLGSERKCLEEWWYLVQFYGSVIRLLVKYSSIFLPILRLKKRPLFLEVFFKVLLNHVYPCFHWFSKTTPTHIYKLRHIFFFCERDNRMLLNCHMSQLLIKSLKNTLIFWIGAFSDQKLMCEEFSEVIDLTVKVSN